MKIIGHIFFLALLFLPYAAHAEDKITEADVRQMIEQIETAVSEYNVENLVSHFIEEATIAIEMPEDMGGKMELSLEEYTNLMEMGWGMYEQYTFEVKDIKISMHPDGLGATVTDTTLETAQFGDEIINVETAETIEVISVKGKSMIKSLHGKAIIDFQQTAQRGSTSTQSDVLQTDSGPAKIAVSRITHIGGHH